VDLLRRLRQPVVVDTLIVLALVALAVLNGPTQRHGHSGPWWLFDVAMAIPLLWRRSQPLVVFLIVAAIGVAQWFLDIPATASLGVLLALYAVGAYQDRRWQIALSALITEVAVVVAAVATSDQGSWATALLLLTGTATAAWVIGVQVRTRRAYLASVIERAATAERERDQQAQIAVAQERDRISREMHDIVAHSLSVMVALSDGAAASVAASPAAAREAMGQASAQGRQALAEIRRLLGAVRAPGEVELAPQPGVAELDDLVAQVRAADLPVELWVTGRLEDVPPSAQLAVYRIVQESLTNVLKHASAARRATVTLSLSPGSADITVEDDGTAAARPAGPDGGHGLTGMRQRAAIYGGEVSAGPLPGGGWRVATRLSFAGVEKA
jgi:signal transduction histidine kinase